MSQNTALPPGYISQWDPNHQRYYFVDTRTGISSWDDPRYPHFTPPMTAESQPPPYSAVDKHQPSQPSVPYSQLNNNYLGNAVAPDAAGLALGGLGGLFVGEGIANLGGYNRYNRFGPFHHFHHHHCGHWRF